ncbi:MAG: FkbM family methyltransferase, partial [Actinomycetota bacterium]|nr:FkbM family methyltransferase [Actinomycetota bacterium]
MLTLMRDQLHQPLVVVDVGCLSGFADVWLQLGNRVQLIGFDPDEDECERLRKHYQQHSNIPVVPVALGSSAGSKVLHLTRQAASSSFYRPDPAILNARPSMRHNLQIVGEAQVELTTLD